MDPKDDATPPGVSAANPAADPPPPPPPPPPPSDPDDGDEGRGAAPRTMTEHRMSAMDRLADQAEARRVAELAEDPDAIAAAPADPTPNADPDADPDDAAASTARLELERRAAAPEPAPGAARPARAAAPDPAGAPPAGAGSDVDPNAIVRLKVDGRIVERRLGDVLRDEQKLLAADARLAEATRIRREAEELLQRSQAAYRPPGSAPNGEAPTTLPPSASPTPPPKETVKARVKDAIAAVFNGDEDAAAERFAEVLAPIATPVTQAPIEVDRVAEAVTRHQQKAAALEGFLGTYQAIKGDEALQDAADAELAHVQRMYPHLSYAEQLARAGNRVYIDNGIPLPSASPAHDPAIDPRTPQPTTDRLRQIADRRAQLDTPVARHGSAAPVGRPTPSSEEERGSIVAQMRAARRGEAPTR